MQGLAPQDISTERLLLRRFGPNDIDSYVEIRSKPAVVEYLPGGREGAQEARQVTTELLVRFERQWSEHGFGPWALVKKASGQNVELEPGGCKFTCAD